MKKNINPNLQDDDNLTEALMSVITTNLTPNSSAHIDYKKFNDEIITQLSEENPQEMTLFQKKLEDFASKYDDRGQGIKEKIVKLSDTIKNNPTFQELKDPVKNSQRGLYNKAVEKLKETIKKKDGLYTLDTKTLDKVKKHIKQEMKNSNLSEEEKRSFEKGLGQALRKDIKSLVSDSSIQLSKKQEKFYKKRENNQKDPKYQASKLIEGLKFKQSISSIIKKPGMTQQKIQQRKSQQSQI